MTRDERQHAFDLLLVRAKNRGQVITEVLDGCVPVPAKQLVRLERATIILNERDRQDAKWGEQNHYPERWLMILAEEVGEANKAVLEGKLEDYLDELVQVGAVALAAIECLARGKWWKGEQP